MKKLFITMIKSIKIFSALGTELPAISMNLSAIFVVLLFSGCSSGSAWDDIDYSRVRGGYDNDSGYSMPSVFGCTSDDLFTCN